MSATLRLVPAGPCSRDIVFDVDYYSSAIWVFTADGELANAASVGWLPVSDELKTELASYAESWTRSALAELHGNPPQPDVPDDAQLDAQANKLCRRLRSELGPGWRVGWPIYGERRMIQWAEDEPPEEWPLPSTPR